MLEIQSLNDISVKDVETLSLFTIDRVIERSNRIIQIINFYKKSYKFNIEDIRVKNGILIFDIIDEYLGQDSKPNVVYFPIAWIWTSDKELMELNSPTNSNEFKNLYKLKISWINLI